MRYGHRFSVALLSFGLLPIAAIEIANIFHFQGNSSASEPRGFYRITHEPFRRGGYVILKMPLKRIAALPGDRVCVSPKGVYCTGNLVPCSGHPRVRACPSPARSLLL